MNKKSLIVLIILILIVFITISNFIGYTDNRFVFTLKEKVPYSLRVFLKKNVFFISDLRSRVEKLKKENIYLRKKVFGLENQSKEIKNYLNFLSKQISEGGYMLPSSDISKNILSKSGNYKYAFKQYLYTTIPWQFNFGKPSGYLGIHGENIVVVSGSGESIYFNSNDLNNDYLNTKIIKNNLLQIINDPKLTEKGSVSIRGILINKNDIFVSYGKEVKPNCYNTSILKSEFNINKLEFKNFLSYKECSESYSNHTGGKMVKYNNDNFLFTIGDAQQFIQAQNDDSIFGKVLLVNFNNASYKQVAKGLRNAQGIFYYAKDDVILLTDHGPTGGDEINAIFQNEIEKKINFGWPISTYGRISKNNYIVIKEQKYSNHEKHGFKEPIKYFSPSIAPSNIINVNEFGKDFENDFFLSTMGYDDGPGRKSIHHYKFDKKYKKIVFEDQIKIGERIRDIIYLSDKKKVVMILENSPAIAVLKFVN